MEVVSERLERLLSEAIAAYRTQYPEDDRPDEEVREVLLSLLQREGGFTCAAGCRDVLFIPGLPLPTRAAPPRARDSAAAQRPAAPPDACLRPGEKVFWMVLRRNTGEVISGLGTAPSSGQVIETVLSFEPGMEQVVWLEELRDWPADEDLERAMAAYERRLQRQPRPLSIHGRSRPDRV